MGGGVPVRTVPWLWCGKLARLATWRRKNVEDSITHFDILHENDWQIDRQTDGHRMTDRPSYAGELPWQSLHLVSHRAAIISPKFGSAHDHYINMEDTMPSLFVKCQAVWEWSRVRGTHTEKLTQGDHSPYQIKFPDISNGAGNISSILSFNGSQFFHINYNRPATLYHTIASSL